MTRIESKILSFFFVRYLKHMGDRDIMKREILPLVEKMTNMGRYDVSKVVQDLLNDWINECKEYMLIKEE